MTETLGDRIKIIRKFILKKKRVDFCSHYSIPEPTLRSWEKNKVKIKEASIDKLINCFIESGINVTTEWLVKGEGEFPTFKKHEAPTDIDVSKKYIKHEIDSKDFLPFLKLGSFLYLEECDFDVMIENIPSFYVIKSHEDVYHYGIIKKCFNGFILNAFKKEHYDVIINKEKFEFYKIIHITQTENETTI